MVRRSQRTKRKALPSTFRRASLSSRLTTLSANRNARERQHCQSAYRLTKEARRLKMAPQQKVYDLRPGIVIDWTRDNAVVVYLASAIDVGLNHYRSSTIADLIVTADCGREIEEVWRSSHPQRLIFTPRDLWPRKHPYQHRHGTQQQNGTGKTSRGLQKEWANCVFPCQPPGLKNGSATTCPLVAYGYTDTQQQIFRLRNRAQRHQRHLRLLQSFPLARAIPACLEMGGDILHLVPGQPAIKII